MVPFDKSATLTNVAMDHKQRNLSKLFEKQDAVALDDLNDDEDQSLASESKASIAGHLRSMLTRTASKMNVTKMEDDDASVVSTSEGSVMPSRSVLSRTASGLSSGLRRGSQLLRTSSFRSMGSFRHKEDAEKGKGSLYGSSRDLNDSSNSSLGSVDILDDLSHMEHPMPSAQSDQPKFDLSLMKANDTQRKDLMVNEEDRSTVWVKSGEEGNQHLQLDIRNHSSFGSLFDDNSHVNYHSSGRSFISDELGSSNPSLLSSRGSNNSIMSSSDLEESHHSRLASARRGRRPRRLSVDRASSGTSFTDQECTLRRHLSANRIDRGGEGGDNLLRSNKSACGIAAEALKNPRRRRTQRPKGFSNMKLHSSSGSIHQADFDAMDRRFAQNQEWSTVDPPKAATGQNILFNKLKTKNSFENPEINVLDRRKDDCDSPGKLPGLNRHSSGRSFRASAITENKDMIRRKNDDDSEDNVRYVNRNASSRSLRTSASTASSRRVDASDSQDKMRGVSRLASGRSLRVSAETEGTDMSRRKDEDYTQNKTRGVNRHSSARLLRASDETESDVSNRRSSEIGSQDKTRGVNRHSSARSLRSSTDIECKDINRKRDGDDSQNKVQGVHRHSSKHFLTASGDSEVNVSSRRSSEIGSQDKTRGVNRHSSARSLRSSTDIESKDINRKRDGDDSQNKVQGVHRHSSKHSLTASARTEVDVINRRSSDVGTQDKMRGLHRHSSRSSLRVLTDTESKFDNQRRGEIRQDKTRGVTRHSSGLSFRSSADTQSKEDKAREVTRTSSGRSCLKAPKRAPSNDMLKSLEDRRDANLVPDKSRNSVARTVSFEGGVASGIAPKALLHHSDSLVGSGDGTVEESLTGTDFDDDNAADKISLRKNLLMGKATMNSHSEDPEALSLKRECTSSGGSFIKAPHVKISQDMLNNLGQSIGVKYRESNGAPASQKSVWRAVSFSERSPSKAPLHNGSHRSISLVNINARQRGDDGNSRNAVWHLGEEDGKDEDKHTRRSGSESVSHS
jgi:hypothetical protein